MLALLIWTRAGLMLLLVLVLLLVLMPFSTAMMGTAALIGTHHS